MRKATKNLRQPGIRTRKTSRAQLRGVFATNILFFGMPYWNTSACHTNTFRPDTVRVTTTLCFILNQELT